MLALSAPGIAVAQVARADLVAPTPLSNSSQAILNDNQDEPIPIDPATIEVATRPAPSMIWTSMLCSG
jgi:hypothetical protein